MTNFNETEIIAQIMESPEFAASQEFIRILREYGFAIGKDLNTALAEGSLDPSRPVQIIISNETIKNLVPSFTNLPLRTKLMMKLGEPKSNDMLNGGLVFCGVLTGGYSAKGFLETNNRMAKTFYGASFLCSASAVGNGGSAVLARRCKLSEVAVLSEACGAAFLHLGNVAHTRALEMEGKPIPPHLQRYKRLNFRRFSSGTKGVAFIMPGQGFGGLSYLIERIPFEKIGKVVGFSLTVYGYSKLVILSYRQGQKLIAKYKKSRKQRQIKSGIVTKQARFLINAMLSCPSIGKPLRIYLVAVSL